MIKWKGLLFLVIGLVAVTFSIMRGYEINEGDSVASINMMRIVGDETG